MNQAFLSVGGKITVVKQGDKLRLYDGSVFSFLEMKRTKFVGKSHKDGKNYLVRYNASLIKEVIGVDSDVLPKIEKTSAFEFGDLFTLQNCKQVFMYVSSINATKVSAIDLASNRTYKVSTNGGLIKVDLNEIKKKAKA